MNAIKGTKRSILTSAMALLLCFAMLLGTTLAWFTDSVTSGQHTITAGNLKIDLLHKVDSDWISLRDNPTHKIFNYNNWEPGYTRVETLKAENLGNLALQYRLSLTVESGSETLGKNGERLSDVIDVFVTYSDSTASSFTAIQQSDEWTYKGTLTEVMANPASFIGGELIPAGKELGNGAEASTVVGAQEVSIALHMRESAGNEYQELSVGNVYVNLVATQWSYEMDSFGKDYDDSVVFPFAPGALYSASAHITTADDGTSASEVMVGKATDMANATIPQGTKLNDGVNEVKLDVSVVENHQAVFELSAENVVFPLDVHIEGIAPDNTVPVIVKINKVFPKGLAVYNVRLYHVEGGVTVEMTSVASLSELDAHNEFYYDAITGEITLAMATFSEVTGNVAIDNPWDGKSTDISWYVGHEYDTEYTLYDTAELRGFAQLVGGMAEGYEGEYITFEGKTVKLGADMNLGGNTGTEDNPVIFEPIGYYFTNDRNGNGNPNENAADIYSDVFSFEGTFDGQGFTVSNILQRTWDIKGDDKYYSLPENQYYNDGMGLFGYVYNGTVKNLVINNFQSDGEYCTTGCVAAYSAGVTSFENIRIVNSNPRAYNVPNGGVVGYAFDDSTSVNEITFTNVIVDNSNKISALWGSWDVACGGILGRMGNATKVVMTNCTVAAEIDVFNDVCGNYQYYQFRYAGMLIGTAGSDSDPSDQIENVTFTNCYVRYGSWATHYYCELVSNSKASYTHDYQFSRLTKVNAIGEISPDGGKTWFKAGNFYLNGECYHIINKDGTLTRYNHDEAGKEIIDGVEIDVENHRAVEIKFNQLYTGYGWGSSPSAVGTNVAEYTYSITYMYANKVYDVVYVIDNTNAVNVTNIAASNQMTSDTPDNQVFSHWVNSGSSKVTEIAAGNTEDVTLYPKWQGKIHTARFVDQFGNVIYEEIFEYGETTQLIGEPAVPHVALCIGSWEAYKLENKDITIRPIYTIDSSKLVATPVDEDGDGDTDYYKVGSINEITVQGNVEIPGYINGIPVRIVTGLTATIKGAVTSIEIQEGVVEITDGAFAYTPNLTELYLPSTIKVLPKNLASRQGQDKTSNFTIYFNGTKDEWDAIEKDDQWDKGMESDCWIICTDATAYKQSKNSSWKWTYNS